MGWWFRAGRAGLFTSLATGPGGGEKREGFEKSSSVSGLGWIGCIAGPWFVLGIGIYEFPTAFFLICLGLHLLEL